MTQLCQHSPSLYAAFTKDFNPDVKLYPLVPFESVRAFAVLKYCEFR
jgi:hypothetical protein